MSNAKLLTGLCTIAQEDLNPGNLVVGILQDRLERVHHQHQQGLLQGRVQQHRLLHEWVLPEQSRGRREIEHDLHLLPRPNPDPSAEAGRLDVHGEPARGQPVTKLRRRSLHPLRDGTLRMRQLCHR